MGQCVNPGVKKTVGVFPNPMGAIFPRTQHLRQIDSNGGYAILGLLKKCANLKSRFFKPRMRGGLLVKHYLLSMKSWMVWPWEIHFLLLLQQKKVMVKQATSTWLNCQKIFLKVRTYLLIFFKLVQFYQCKIKTAILWMAKWLKLPIAL